MLPKLMEDRPNCPTWDVPKPCLQGRLQTADSWGRESKKRAVSKSHDFGPPNVVSDGKKAHLVEEWATDLSWNRLVLPRNPSLSRLLELSDHKVWPPKFLYLTTKQLMLLGLATALRTRSSSTMDPATSYVTSCLQFRAMQFR